MVRQRNKSIKAVNAEALINQVVRLQANWLMKSVSERKNIGYDTYFDSLLELFRNELPRYTTTPEDRVLKLLRLRPAAEQCCFNIEIWETTNMDKRNVRVEFDGLNVNLFG